MGLDQYAYVAARAGQLNEWYEGSEMDPATAEFVNPKMTRPREIAYWRKHPNLQGWMRRLWEERGCPGVPEGAAPDVDRTFNGIELELFWQDIERLHDDVVSGRLPNTTGFFFGDHSDDYYREQDLEFCRQARAALFLGERVFYDSSW
jgi:hypothetical protein